MKALERFLHKNNLEYRAERFGCNYFNDHGLDLHFPGVVIGFDNIKDEMTVQRYCERYHFSIITRGGFPGYHFFWIVRSEAAAAMDLYFEYQNASVKACEKEIHFSYEYFGRGNDPDLNDRLLGIMEYYEDEYKKALARGILRIC